MKPSIGRIVIYNYCDGVKEATKVPAIVQNIAEDKSIKLFVFGSTEGFIVEGIIEGEDFNQWNWPEQFNN